MLISAKIYWHIIANAMPPVTVSAGILLGMLQASIPFCMACIFSLFILGWTAEAAQFTALHILLTQPTASD